MDLFTTHYPLRNRYRQSAYYYWYRFMQLVPGYDAEHPLWADFGDVRMPFWDWWVEHGEGLFIVGSERGVWQIDSDDEIAEARREGAYLLRVDRNCTREYLLSTFRGFLEENKISASPGRRRHGEEVKFARYPFHQRPDVATLRTILDVWQRRHPRLAGGHLSPKRTRNAPTLYSVGLALGLGKAVNADDAKEDRMKARNVMDATVSRYERWGRSIIENVGLGIFPKLTAASARSSSRAKGNAA